MHSNAQIRITTAATMKTNATSVRKCEQVKARVPVETEPIARIGRVEAATTVVRARADFRLISRLKVSKSLCVVKTYAGQNKSTTNHPLETKLDESPVYLQ